MDKLKQQIDDKRNIKESTLNSYMISLRKLHEAIEGNKAFTNLNFLTDEKKVLDVISELKMNTQKNYISAAIVALHTVDAEKYEKELLTYRKYIDEFTKKNAEDLSTNEKTPDQERNWVTMEQLKRKMNEYKRDLEDRNVFNKETLTKKQTEMMQKWVVAASYVISPENPPLRLDYGDMSVITKNEYDDLTDDEKDGFNYLVNETRNTKFFSLGDYKTHGSHGTLIIPVSQKLNAVYNIWLKHNTSGNFLRDSRGGNMSSNQLSKYLPQVFNIPNKKITLNLIRHVFISTHFPVELTDKQKRLAKRMGHSVLTQNQYAKK